MSESLNSHKRILGRPEKRSKKSVKILTKESQELGEEAFAIEYIFLVKLVATMYASVHEEIWDTIKYNWLELLDGKQILNNVFIRKRQ